MSNTIRLSLEFRHLSPSPSFSLYCSCSCNVYVRVLLLISIQSRLIPQTVCSLHITLINISPVKNTPKIDTDLVCFNHSSKHPSIWSFSLPFLCELSSLAHSHTLFLSVYFVQSVYLCAFACCFTNH